MMNNEKQVFSELALIQQPGSMEALIRLSELRAQDRTMLPAQFHNNPGACLSVGMLALQWGIPFNTVAQKTFIQPGGKIGFESQLVMAVLHQSGYLNGRLQVTAGGDWWAIRGKVKEIASNSEQPNGGKRPKVKLVRGWSDADEQYLSITVSGTLAGETAPRTTTVYLADVYIKSRFSTLWVTDPKKQLGYLAVRRWASEHCPEPMMGLSSDEEIIIAHELQQKDSAPRKTVDEIIEDVEIVDEVKEPQSRARGESEDEVLDEGKDEGEVEKESVDEPELEPHVDPKVTAFYEAINALQTVEEAESVRQKLQKHRAALGGHFSELARVLMQRGSQISAHNTLAKMLKAAGEKETLTREDITRIEQAIKYRVDKISGDQLKSSNEALDKLRDRVKE